MTDETKGTAVAPRNEEPNEPAGTKLLALAKTQAERAFAFGVMEKARRDKLILAAARELSHKTWGKDCSLETKKAIAIYAYQTGTDPVRHWDVIGNNLYDNAQLWMDLVTERPDYMGFEVEHVNDDDRLDDGERTRRRARRAEHNLPDDTKGAAIVTIFRAAGSDVVRLVGANHAGHRRGYNAKLRSEKKERTNDLILDPIGEQDPGKTAETRAFRRAAKKGWSIWPVGMRQPTDDGIPLGESMRRDMATLIADDRASVKALQSGSTHLDAGKSRLSPESLALCANPYEDPDQPEGPTVTQPIAGDAYDSTGGEDTSTARGHPVPTSSPVEPTAEAEEDIEITCVNCGAKELIPASWSEQQPCVEECKPGAVMIPTADAAIRKEDEQLALEDKKR